MKAIEILSAEHRVIERVLSCLEIMAGNCEREGKLDAGPARRAVATNTRFPRKLSAALNGDDR